MMPNQSINSKENIWLWLIKIITGILIITLILIHFIVNHLISENGLLTRAEVINYYKYWFVPIMEIVFLVLAVSHSLIGVRSILLDLNPSQRTVNFFTFLLILLGIGFIIYGIWLVWVIQSF